MSILSIAEKVAEYNKDKPSRFDAQANYELTDADTQKLLHIAECLRKINTPILVQVTMLENCKQIYLKCRERPNGGAPQKTQSLVLPSIHKDKKKV